MKRWRNTIIVGVATFILTVAIFVQINTIDEITKEIGSPLRENRELREEYIRSRGRYNAALTELQRMEHALSTVRNQSLSGSDEDIDREAELKQNQALLGLTSIRGNGITIVIDDNREAEQAEAANLSGSLIHQDDILNIVNELFNAGADAVSVGDERSVQRVITTTPIMCDGNIIRVNNEIVGVPVTIRAIGSSPALYHALMRPGGFLNILENDGINVLVQWEDNVLIPRFEGTLRNEHIRNGG